MPGTKGTVTGTADGHEDVNVGVKFDGHANKMDVPLSEISRTLPIPGDLSVGDTIYSRISFSDKYGSISPRRKGRVTGVATKDPGTRLRAEFQGYGRELDMKLMHVHVSARLPTFDAVGQALSLTEEAYAVYCDVWSRTTTQSGTISPGNAVTAFEVCLARCCRFQSVSLFRGLLKPSST